MSWNPLEVRPLTLTAGTRLGTYEIVAPLGAGGMGEVYRDQIRGKLTGLPGVEVIARGSSTPYRKTTKTPQEIAKELSANYLLTAATRDSRSSSPPRSSARRRDGRPGEPPHPCVIRCRSPISSSDGRSASPWPPVAGHFGEKARMPPS